MKKRVLAAVACFTLVLVAFTLRVDSAEVPAYVNAKVVPPRMASTVAALREKTALAILVPPSLSSDAIASFDAATSQGYTLYADLAPGCQGAHACGWFTLIAKKAASADERVHDKRIALGRGVDGDLTPSEMNAYPSDTVIAWRLGSTSYTLYVNSHAPDPEQLARAIVGNLITVPQPSTLK